MGRSASGGAEDGTPRDGGADESPRAIEWQKIYFRIQGHKITDTSLNSWESFLEQPDWYVLEYLEELERNRREQVNLNSYTQAIGWSGLFNGFAGDEGKKTAPQDLLPFKDDVESSNQKISDHTRKIISEAIKSKQLSPAFATALAALL